MLHRAREGLGPLNPQEVPAEIHVLECIERAAFQGTRDRLGPRVRNAVAVKIEEFKAGERAALQHQREFIGPILSNGDRSKGNGTDVWKRNVICSGGLRRRAFERFKRGDNVHLQRRGALRV